MATCCSRPELAKWACAPSSWSTTEHEQQPLFAVTHLVQLQLWQQRAGGADRPLLQQQAGSGAAAVGASGLGGATCFEHVPASVLT